jgi:hypothetical protein
MQDRVKYNKHMKRFTFYNKFIYLKTWKIKKKKKIFFFIYSLFL